MKLTYELFTLGIATDVPMQNRSFDLVTACLLDVVLGSSLKFDHSLILQQKAVSDKKNIYKWAM